MAGLGNLANKSRSYLPKSNAEQTALNLRATLASPTFTMPVSCINASMVGFGNVNNTSDANKPLKNSRANIQH
jgi:hypothetical protein